MPILQNIHTIRVLLASIKYTVGNLNRFHDFTVDTITAPAIDGPAIERPLKRLSEPRC